MVRLKEHKLAGLPGLLSRFQFQYGSIKRVMLFFPKVGDPYFNSNMVRLKDSSGVILISFSYNFNSNMVRLKAVQKYRKKCLFSRLSGFLFHVFQLKLSSTLNNTKTPGVRQGAKLLISKMSKNDSFICPTQKCKIIFNRQL